MDQEFPILESMMRATGMMFATRAQGIRGWPVISDLLVMYWCNVLSAHTSQQHAQHIHSYIFGLYVILDLSSTGESRNDYL